MKKSFRLAIEKLGAEFFAEQQPSIVLEDPKITASRGGEIRVQISESDWERVKNVPEVEVVSPRSKQGWAVIMLARCFTYAEQNPALNPPAPAASETADAPVEKPAKKSKRELPAQSEVTPDGDSL